MLANFRSLGNALYPELASLGIGICNILDHWEMRSIRNHGPHELVHAWILDHWEMRSIRNLHAELHAALEILDHWEMRSIRNLDLCAMAHRDDFRSLGNALYPEHKCLRGLGQADFRSLGNALYPEQSA